MRAIGIGIIGWGFMGKTHTLALRQMPLFYPGIDFAPRLAAVCSRDVSKAERAKDEMGFGFATGDWRELIARPEVEVVSVCTPNELHEEMAVAALNAGKHVYLDKPMADTLEGAKRIAEAARKSSAKLQIAHNHRFMTATMRARELMDEGALGEILSFSLRFLHSGSVDEARPAGWKQLAGAGVLLDLGSHVIDLANWLMGMPQAVHCAARTLYAARPTKGGGVTNALAEDQAIITMRLPNGALGTIEASKIATGACDELLLEIRGKKGAVRWSLMDANWLAYYDNARPETPLGGTRGWTKIECASRYPAPGGAFLPAKSCIGWERGHLHSYYTFLDCVCHDLVPAPSWREGLETQTILDACVRSDAEGRWIEL